MEKSVASLIARRVCFMVCFAVEILFFSFLFVFFLSFEYSFFCVCGDVGVFVVFE